MFLMQWIQKRRDERRQRRETEAHETKKHLERMERDLQQTQALLLKVSDLQQTMDPLIAAQYYNQRFCPLTSRLPEGILLHTISFLREDPALHCLRITSRLFFRILDLNSTPWLRNLVPASLSGRQKPLVRLSSDMIHKLKPFLQIDMLCDDCRWTNIPRSSLSYAGCKFRQISIDSDLEYESGYCACNASNNLCRTYYSQQQSTSHWRERKCLGQQGSVQLCEHVQIPLTIIQTHIDNWRLQHPRDANWKECLNTFKIECRDPSHDMRCTASEASTWPQARLLTGTKDPGVVVLNLNWTPHSRLDALNLDDKGRIPASNFRALLQIFHQLGPAELLCPLYRPGSFTDFTEMACSGLSCPVNGLLHYGTEQYNTDEPPPSLTSPLPSTSWLWDNRYGKGMNGRKVTISLDEASGTDNSRKHVQVSYDKDILICETAAIREPSIKILPTHWWLHSMDPRTYPNPQAQLTGPYCENKTCLFYSQRLRDLCTYAYGRFSRDEYVYRL